jgi:tRNA threonylcarbamoyl adenosine modification protein YeaZ
LKRSTRLFDQPTLVIETATDACSVALFHHRNLVDARHEVIGRGHAERLIMLVAELPGGGRADHILVSCGPGSFTGVRVGVAAARGLGLGWGSSVSGYSTLAAIAAQTFFDHATVTECAVAMHGGHGELFTQCFVRNSFAATDALASQSVEAAAALIKADYVVGTAAEALVAARGYGQAITPQLTAASALLLPEPFLSLAPTPIYGRGADAKPMQ